MDKYEQILASFGSETTCVYFTVKSYELILNGKYDEAQSILDKLKEMLVTYGLDIYCNTIVAKVQSFLNKVTSE